MLMTESFALPELPPAISFACSACGMALTVQMAGVTGPCPRCGQVLTAPGEPAGVPLTPPVQVVARPAQPRQTPPPLPPLGLAPNLISLPPMMPGSQPRKGGEARVALWLLLGVAFVAALGWAAAGWTGAGVGLAIGLPFAGAVLLLRLLWRVIPNPAVRGVVITLLVAFGGLGFIAVIGIVAAVMIPPMDAHGHPLASSKGLTPGMPAGAASARQVQLAVMRKLVQDKAPGTYTDADFAAAEKAALAASSDEVAMKTYVQVMKFRQHH